MDWYKTPAVDLLCPVNHTLRTVAPEPFRSTATLCKIYLAWKIPLPRSAVTPQLPQGPSLHNYHATPRPISTQLPRDPKAHLYTITTRPQGPSLHNYHATPRPISTQLPRDPKAHLYTITTRPQGPSLHNYHATPRPISTQLPCNYLRVSIRRDPSIGLNSSPTTSLQE